MGPILKDSNTLTIFASSTNSNIKTLGKNIFSTSEDPRKTLSAFVKIIHSKYKGKKGLILYFPEDYFSLDQKNLWLLECEKNPDLELTFLPLKGSGSDPETLNKIKQFGFIVITSFPTRAFDILTALNKSKIDYPFLQTLHGIRLTLRS